ncbi:MAG: hypothetical protein ABII88_04585 [Candidatus Omnitrophota bacterium]
MSISIKAVNIVSSKEFIKEKFGKESLQKVIEALSEKDRQIIDPPELYGYELIDLDSWTNFFKEVVAQLSGGDESVIEEAGRHNAIFELKTMYRIFLEFVNPEFSIKMIPTIFSTYFTSDEYKMYATTAKLEKNKYLIKAHRFETRFRLMEIGILGWLKEFFDRSGGKEVNVVISKSLTQGEGIIEYIVSWK